MGMRQTPELWQLFSHHTPHPTQISLSDSWDKSGKKGKKKIKINDTLIPTEAEPTG